MFMTYVKVCSLIATSTCTEFVDTQGPYDSYQQCETRAVEMAKDLAQVLAGPIEFSYKCEKEIKGHAT